ncbi:MAG: alpha-2-macroglobulin family protein, partial [Bradymonadaceae bacterium]
KTQQWLDVVAGPQTWSFELAEHAPNVYVTAMIIKDPRLESKDAFLPERAFGASSVTVERTPFERMVKLTVPEEMRPATKLKVQLDVGARKGKTYATIAAVDEGILQLTRYESPDPLAMLLSRRALGVTTFDTVGWSLQIPPGGPSGRTGGGDEGDYGAADGSPGRIMPFKPVALWTGIVEVPANGKLEVELDVPLYQGSLRVMATVFDDERMGTAEEEVLVRDPLSVQATFPRFITVTDEVDIPVFVSNLTEKDRVVELYMTSDEYDEPGISRGPDKGSLIELQQDRRVVEVGAGKSTTTIFKARAARASGAATFQVFAKSDELESMAEGLVPFRAAGPLERKTERIPILTSHVGLDKMLEGWEPTSETTNVWLTTHANAEAFDHLRFLVRYPHGCLEQTTSTTRPLLYVFNLLRQVDPSTVARGGSVEKMVMHGVNRILSFQQTSGGFAYWSGGGDVYPWASAYATHLLIDARSLGYDIPQERIDRALGWLEQQAKPDASTAYVHYVLAKAGKGRQAQARRAIESMGSATSGADSESAYLLKAALYLSGDRSFERDLKNPIVDATSANRSLGGSYYSDRRRRGLMLDVFHELFGNDPGGMELVQAVGRDLSGKSNRYTTQELVWGITGLGKWHEKAVEDVADAKLVANGRTIGPASDEAGRSLSWSLARASEYGDLTLQVDKKDEGALFLVVSSEGVRTSPNVKYGGDGLKITRTYRDANGRMIEGDKYHLGDMVYVHVTLQNTSNKVLENIALVDRLPAGWEIENPNLGRSAAPNWTKSQNQWESDHRNVRDDRMEVFGTIKRGETVHLVYVTRATLAGKFHVPTIEAEAMYDPTIWAREKPGSVLITGPWGDELVD